MESSEIGRVVIDTITRVGLRVLGAIVLWIVGRMLIKLVIRLVARAFSMRHLDATISRYLCNILNVVLNIALAVAILGFFGVETTTFAALVAAAGVAIGVAWGGLLGNFAAGVFLIILQPFKVGEFITAGGVTGTVREIGLFVTSVDTPDNVMTIIGNNKIFADTIQNFSANPYRRVDLVAQLNHGVDHLDATRRLKEQLARIPNVLTDPAPDVEILSFNLAGPVLAVRPYCHNRHYWQVYFETNRVIREAFGAAGYPVPEQHYAMRGGVGGPASQS
jgi:small conductance mechanosensitive channel